MSERLDSWKQIAAYLGREVRTVQRWERERRLPVQRLPGGDKPRVYALKSELDAWLRTNRPEPADGPSVAVLPFANLTGDKENEYFGDGLADEIITALTRVPGLRVTARTSSFAFRGKEQDVRTIGARLGALALLEGSVRRSVGRVRISAQLVSAEDGYHLWSETYDRELADIFSIQDEIARSITLALRVRLAPGTLVAPATGDPEAYDLWLKGRCMGALYTPGAFPKACECFTAALARDPRFPLPYVSMAELLLDVAELGLVPPLEAAARAKGAILKALALTDALGGAHAVLGHLRGVFEFNWTGADHAFQRALELSPGSSEVLIRHTGAYLMPKLRFEEAQHEMRRAVERDPLSPLVHATLGLVLIAARDYKGAEEECRAAVQLAPGLWFSHWLLGWALILEGRIEEGMTHCRQSGHPYEEEPLGRAGRCLVYGWVGETDEAARAFSELADIARTRPVPRIAYAWAYLGLRDDRVFEWLEKAIEAREPLIMHMPSMYYYDGIRADPRFQALLARMGLA